jgi:hypothetical protein
MVDGCCWQLFRLEEVVQVFNVQASRLVFVQPIRVSNIQSFTKYVLTTQVVCYFLWCEPEKLAPGALGW